MFALALLLLAPQGDVAAGNDRHSAVRIQVSGAIDLHYLYRGGAVNEAGGILNGVPAPSESSTSAWSGRVSLRADIDVRDAVSGVVELENRSYDEGLNRPFASDPETDDLDLKQAYLEVGEFLAPSLAIRLGVQNVTYRNRPHDEPFFIDLGESEGFFDGASPAGHVRNTVDRDVREAAGVKANISAYEIFLLQGLAAVYGEGGDTSSDESVYALVVNAAIPDSFAAWILAALVSGGDPDLEQVWTVGAGVNGYLGEGRPLELFGEGYLQRGALTEEPRHVSKRAFAFNAGARYVGILDIFWLEAAVSYRSGDKRVGDGRDEAFQSYENENRFVILQSAEFGLDVDTNVRVVRAAIGAGPFEIAAGRPLRVQVDVGQFTADERLRDAAGAVLTAGREDDWGLEVDGQLIWNYNASLTFRLKGAWLAGSSILEDLTGGPDDAALGLFGADLKF